MVRPDFPRIAIPSQGRQLLAQSMTKQALQSLPRDQRQLPDGAHAHIGQPLLRNGPHAPHQLDWQVVQEPEFTPWIDHDQPVGLADADP